MKLYYNLMSMIFNKPSVSLVKQRGINLYFSSSVDKRHVFLNLDDISSLEFVIRLVKNDSSDTFELYAVKNVGKNEEDVKVAIFDSKPDAEFALKVIKTKMFSPEKFIVKFSLVAFIVVFLWGIGVDIAYVNIQKSRLMLVPQNVQAIPQGQAPAQQNQLSMEQLNQLMQQAAQQSVPQQAPQAPQAPAPAPVPAPNASQNPQVNDFLDSLKK